MLSSMHQILHFAVVFFACILVLYLIFATMLFKSYLPSEALAPFVKDLFIFESYTEYAERVKKVVVPNGVPSLILQFADRESICYNHLNEGNHPHRAAIVGQLTVPHYIEHIGKVGVVGVHFRPSGLYQIFGLPAWKFKDKSTDMIQLFGSKVMDLCNQLVNAKDNDCRINLTEGFLFNNISIVDITLKILNKSFLKEYGKWLTISELAKQLGLNKRQLQRKFNYEIGLSPQAYKKLLRFNKVVSKLELQLPEEWQELTYEAGYFDQAHMIHEFKKYAGSSPTKFVKDPNKFSFNSNS